MIRNKANLFEQVISFSNLLEATQKAVKGKRLKRDLSNFINHREEALINLQAELRDQTWRPGGFHTFQIYEPKPRLISSTRFKDRVVHQALCQVIAKDLDRMSVEDSYACRQGKGLHKAIEKVQVESRKWEYYLKIDIMHFFETADHAVLLSMLKRLFKDSALLNLMKIIIDDGAPGSQPGKGLPIGNLTSQYWSNFYLGKLDLMIKHDLKVKGYVRYMDDMLLFANEIPTLQSHLVRIKTFVENELKLKLKDQATLLASVSHGIPYLGFRIWRKTIRLDFARKLRLLKKLKQFNLSTHTPQLETLLAWADVGNTYQLIKSWGNRHEW
jgi:RNA-directed DNA polymerase